MVNPSNLNTGMFDGVVTKVPWLLPILEEQTVADRVVDAVTADRRRLIMPRGGRPADPMHVRPVKLFDTAIDMLGVNDTTKGFHGRG